MLTLPLEPTDDLADPAFKDNASCTTWLAQLQLTNLQPAHSQLLFQLLEFNRYPMRGLDRLNTLEQLRETIGYVQDNYSYKLIGKPLPLNENEMKVFVAIVQLWQALVTGYQRCLQAYIAGDKLLADQGALLCHRCLQYTGLAIFEHLRCSYEFDPKLWHQLHELYSFAERNGLQLAEVPDPLNTIQPRASCERIYVKTLLACYARPAELNRVQLQLLDGWLSEWSTTVTVEHSYTRSRGDAQPLATDLASTHGLLPIKSVIDSESMRYIAMVPLSKLLRVKTILMQQGDSPQQQKLGDNCTGNDCIEFLTFLHQCWCEDRNTRSNDRLPVTHPTRLCIKLENIYAHLSGNPFKQHGNYAAKASPSRKQTESLGKPSKDSPDQALSEKGFPLEAWLVENQSILGARLTRENKTSSRLSFNQLVAFHPVDSTTSILGVNKWILATTKWVNVTLKGHLDIGVQYLPGAAEAVRIALTDSADTEKFLPALLLQEVQALKTPPSLILERGCFQPDRLVKIEHIGNEFQQIKLGFCVERGFDFERVSFTTV
jgi:cyclic-di-GMP-binding protein